MKSVGSRRIAIGLAIMAGGFGGCQVEGTATGVVNNSIGTFRASNVEAVIGPDGQCEADVNLDPSTLRPPATAVRPGITECDLVRLQGRPQDVVVADLPDGRRSVEMFYPGNGGTTRGYVFIANRLVSTPPGTLKE
ncbi:MAG: hypothetical protein JO163_20495 [Methylobacteriaceae bacterium]|nr:hypothetical protein [Methylobacteriaceae bacterium]